MCVDFVIKATKLEGDLPGGGNALGGGHSEGIYLVPTPSRVENVPVAYIIFV
jgi:hypothetical protein